MTTRKLAAVEHWALAATAAGPLQGRRSARPPAVAPAGGPQTPPAAVAPAAPPDAASLAAAGGHDVRTSGRDGAHHPGGGGLPAPGSQTAGARGLGKDRASVGGEVIGHSDRCEPVTSAAEVCPRCGREPVKVRGWCKRCYMYWFSRGKPGRAAQMRAARARREDYLWLRTEQRLTLAQAASTLGVTERTAQRYEALLREQVSA